MKVINKIGKEGLVEFKHLAVGDAYYDKEGNLCIKTNNPDWSETSYGTCLVYLNGSWIAEEEHETAKCTVLKTEFIILGYA